MGRKLLVLLMCVIFFICSCSPRMHIVGGGMRYHNLSQNKYQPRKERGRVNLGTSPRSPFWIIFGRF